MPQAASRRPQIESRAAEEALAEYEDAVTRRDEAAEVVKEAGERIRSTGLNLKGVMLGLKLGAMKPAEAAAIVNDAMLIARLRGYEFANQLGLFEQAEAVDLADAAEARSGQIVAFGGR